MNAGRGERGLDGRIAAGVFLALFALYWTLRCPAYGPGDSAQHALSALTLGVSRPPGYPLYVFLARLFAAVAPGPRAAAVGGFSALCAAAACALLFWCLRRQGCSRPGAASAAALAAFAPLLWFYAQMPEVRALNDLLALAALALALRYAEAPSGGRAAAFGLLCGLGASHHPTFAFVLPSLALAAGRRPRGREAWAAGAALAAGWALPYAALWLRLRWGAPPVYNPGGVSSAADVLALFLRRDTGGLLSVVTASAAPGMPAARPFLWLAQALWRDATPAGLALAAGGLATAAAAPRRAGVWALWLILPALGYAALSARQLAGPPDYLRGVAERFYVLPELGLFALAGWGVDALGRGKAKPYLWAVPLLFCLRAALPVDLRGRAPLRGYALDVAAQARDGDVVAAVSDDAFAALLYEQKAEGRLRGVTLVAPALLGYAPYVERLAREHPDLRFPARNGRLSRSLKDWAAVNPGRGFWAEAVAGPALKTEFPAAVPEGVLLRLTPPFAPAAERRRLFSESSLARLRPEEVHAFTQEVYLPDAREALEAAFAAETATAAPKRR